MENKEFQFSTDDTGFQPKEYRCSTGDMDFLDIEPAGKKCLIGINSYRKDISLAILLTEQQVHELIEHLKTFKPTT